MYGFPKLFDECMSIRLKSKEVINGIECNNDGANNKLPTAIKLSKWAQ